MILRMVLVLVCIPVLSASTCAHPKTRIAEKVNQPVQTSSSLPKGAWGGQGISLDATDEGARLEFDCAHGSINEKLTPNREGKFEAKGVFVRERPGPVRRDETASEQPVIYVGTTDGKTMSLTIKSAEGEEIATYTLTHGRNGRLVKCK
jgi:hypothetical protein